MTDPAELAKRLRKRKWVDENGPEATLDRAAAAMLDQLASTMSAEEVREAALDFIVQVQTELLSQDEILLKFNLDRLGRLLGLLAPTPKDTPPLPRPSAPRSSAT